jgi:hypothetical protein
VKLPNPIKATSAFFNSDSVLFRSNRKWNNQKKWPYLNGFIPRFDGTSTPLWGGLGRPGWVVPAGGNQDIIIVNGQDAAYRLINYKIRACAFQPDATGSGSGAGTITSINISTGAVVGLASNFTTLFGLTGNTSNPFKKGSVLSYVTTDTTPGNLAFGVIASVNSDTSLTLEPASVTLRPVNPANSWTNSGCVWYQTEDTLTGTTFAPILPGSATPAPKNTFRYLPLTEKIGVEVVVKSNSARNLTGGLSSSNRNSIFPEAIKQSTMQGEFNGVGQLRVPYLTPMEGTLLLRVTNKYTKDIIVSGNTFGYKIALDTD